MPTDKQIAANRRNARKSTGPRTEAGKNKTRLNAVTHGLTGHLELTTDPARDAFIAGIIGTLKPADPLEHQLAQSIADGYWRINRVSTLENALLAADADDILRAINLLSTYETRLHRKIRLDLQQLRELQSTRRAAAEKENAVSQKAFEECCTLLELKMRRTPDLKLDGDFTHPNGFVFSIRKLFDAMTAKRRMSRAQQNLTTNPYTLDQLERFQNPHPAA